MLSAATPGWIAAQDATPESVAQAYLTSMAEEGLAASGRFIAESDLEKMRASFLSLFEALDTRVPENESPQQQVAVLQMLFGVPSVEELRALDAHQFYGKLMGMLQTNMESMGMKPSGGIVLGTVSEGTDLAHVVARVAVSMGDGEQMKMVDVVSLRRENAAWKVLLSAEVDRMIDGLLRQLETLVDTPADDEY